MTNEVGRNTFLPTSSKDIEKENEVDDYQSKGSVIEIKGGVFVKHVGKYYEFGDVIEWLRISFNREMKAKKKSSKENYKILIDNLRNDLLREFKKGNINAKFIRFLKDYPAIVGSEIIQFYEIDAKVAVG